MNKSLLLSYMVKNGDTQEELAEAMGLSLSRLNAKINRRNGAMFNQAEIDFIFRRYKFTPNEIVNIFFAKPISYQEV